MTAAHQGGPAPRVTALSGSVIAVVGPCLAVSAALRAGWASANVRLEVAENEGTAFGLFGGNATLATGLAVTGLVVFGPIMFRLWRGSTIPTSALALLLGGALANLAERLVTGAVLDYLVVGEFIVNLADLAMLVGLARYVTALCFRPATTNAATESAGRTPAVALSEGSSPHSPGHLSSPRDLEGGDRCGDPTTPSNDVVPARAADPVRPA